MDLKFFAGAALLAVTLGGCRHPSPQAVEGAPTLTLKAYDVLKVPSGGGNIHAEGLGATPNSDVAVALNYSTSANENQVLLQTVKSDGSGGFTYRGYQRCLFPAKSSAPVRVSLEARDAGTGSVAETPDLDPAFLICPN